MRIDVQVLNRSLQLCTLIQKSSTEGLSKMCFFFFWYKLIDQVSVLFTHYQQSGPPCEKTKGK